MLRRRCFACAARIPAVYPLLEIGTAALFCTAWFVGGATPRGAALAGLAVLGPPLFVIDVQQQRLPNVLVGAAAAWLIGCSIAQGVFYRSAATPGRALLCGAGAAAALLLLAIATNGGMGMGDVKLAGTLGIASGLIAWSTAVAALVWAFFIGGVIAAVLLILGRAQRGTAIAFGPMLLIGALVAVLQYPNGVVLG